MKKRNLGDKILFAEAKARVDEIARLIDEYNEIAETLRALGYGQFPQSHDGDEFEYLPHLILGSGNAQHPDSSFVAQVWEDGPVGKGNVRAMSPRAVVSAKERSKLGNRCGWRCFYCGEQGDEEKGPDDRVWHVDHIYPVVKGGDDKPDNKALSCATCNLQKSARTALDHFRFVSIAREDVA